MAHYYFIQSTQCKVDVHSLLTYNLVGDSEEKKFDFDSPVPLQARSNEWWSTLTFQETRELEEIQKLNDLKIEHTGETYGSKAVSLLHRIVEESELAGFKDFYLIKQAKDFLQGKEVNHAGA